MEGQEVKANSEFKYVNSLPTELCGIRMRNPTVLSSGLLGFNAESFIRAAHNGAGAVTLKSISPRERPGAKNPKVIEWKHGVANCFGLTSPGVDNMDEEWEGLKKCRVPVIASIVNFPPGDAKEQFVEVAQKVAERKPAIIEVNLSCPHSAGSGMAVGTEPDRVFDVVSAVKDAVGKAKVMPKLTPNTHKFVEIGKACEEAGADAVSAINTLGPGMFINTDVMKPVLSVGAGGLSGPAVRPVGVRCVYQLYEAVEIPIQGIGGISTAEDALEYLLAGASAVGIGSGMYYSGIDIFGKVADGIGEWMQEKGFSKIEDFRGKAHE